MQVLELCADVFLSPVLMEAMLLSAVLPRDEFINFFKTYLPKFKSKRTKTLFSFVKVSDKMMEK